MIANLSDATPVNRSVNSNVESLLTTGAYSDLTLICQGHEFFVHRAILCPRSPVWAAATEGNFNVSVATKSLFLQLIG